MKQIPRKDLEIVAALLVGCSYIGIAKHYGQYRGRAKDLRDNKEVARLIRERGVAQFVKDYADPDAVMAIRAIMRQNT